MTVELISIVLMMSTSTIGKAANTSPSQLLDMLVSFSYDVTFTLLITVPFPMISHTSVRFTVSLLFTSPIYHTPEVIL